MRSHDPGSDSAAAADGAGTLARPLVSLRLGLLSLLVVGAAGYLTASVAAMPEHLSARLAAGGAGAPWLDRWSYLRWLLGMLLVLPVGSTLLLWAMRYSPVPLLNVPNRDYWLAPIRRAATYQAVLALGADLGCAEVLVVLGLHALISSAQGPAHEPSPWSWGLMLAAVGFILARLVWFIRGFAIPGKAAAQRLTPSR